MESMACQGLAVPSEVMHHVVRVESSFNPFAIGVVGGRLVRQPRNLPEALATVRMLENRGFNFSIGLAQVNRYNLEKYGLDSYEQAFESCANLQAGSKILAECYRRAGRDWGKSFSCYYSGNFSTGFRHGYVQKIYASLRQSRDSGEAPSVPAIEVVSRSVRGSVPVTRLPLYRARTGVAAADPGAPPAARPTRMQPVPSRVDIAAPGPEAAPMAQTPFVETGFTAAPVAQPLDAANTPQAASWNNDIGRAVVIAPSAAAAAAEPPPVARRRDAVDKALIVDAPERDAAFVF